MFSWIKQLSGKNLLYVLVTLNVLLYIALVFSPVKPNTFGDFDFHEEAKIISKFVHGDAPYEAVSITKAPGPVFLYVIPYTLAGSGATDKNYWLAGFIWIGVLTIFSLAVLYKRLAAVYGFRVANIFMGLTFIIPLHIYYSLGIMAEGMAFLAAVWAIIGFLEPGKMRKAIFYVGGLTFLILARPNSALLIPFLFIFAVYFAWIKKQREYYKYAFYSVYAFVIIAGVTILVKSLPNTRQTKNQEQYLAFVMHHGRFQFRSETFDWRFWDDFTRADSKDYINWRKSKDELEGKIDSGADRSIYYTWIFNDVASHPLTAVKQFFVRILFGNALQVSSLPAEDFKVAGINGRLLYWILHIILNCINVIILGFAIYWLCINGNIRKYWPLYTVIIALWIFHGAIYMEQRYLFPSRPIIILFAAMALNRLIEAKKSKHATARNIVNSPAV